MASSPNHKKQILETIMFTLKEVSKFTLEDRQKKIRSEINDEFELALIVNYNSIVTEMAESRANQED
jgi:hypothetical protein